MNKTNYIILISFLCTLIIFMVYPINVFGQAITNDVSNISNQDFGSEPDPGEVEIGDTFTGPSGTEYELQEENLGAEELAYYDEIGISADGIWVEVEEEKERKKYKYKVCTTGAGCAEAGRCVNTSTYNKNKADECQTDSDCAYLIPPPSNEDILSNGGTPSNEDAPSNWGTPSNGGTPPSNGGGYTPPVWTPPVSPPPPPEPLPCMINYFELPDRAWVGYPITGTWSASDWCDDCDVDCTPYPECVWKQDSIGTGFDEYKFTLEQSGTYNYTLTCYGEGGIDERTEIATVEALNLPWWREIIPVLPGFLRGIWR